MELQDTPIPQTSSIPPTPPAPKTNSSLVLTMSIFLIITVAIAGLFYFQIQKLSKELSKYQTQPSPTPTATTDPTANWKPFVFSPTISLKLPQDIKDPLYVNVGHYAQETTLPGSTIFQIWGADGASPSGGKDNYNTTKQKITSNSMFQTKIFQLQNLEALEFLASTPSSEMVWGGEVYTNLRGVLVKTPDNRALVLIHYEGQTLKNGDFKSDNLIFDQILSTFKFLDQNTVTNNCVDEKDSILAVISTFENLQKNKDPKGVLALFTPPQSQEETSNYQNLSGEDAQVSPRLYNNVSTNYNTLSYKITQQPAKLPGEFCSVTVEEQRSNYGGPTNPQYLPAQTEEFVLILTRLDGKWKVDQYQSGNPKIKKGKYAGFLMEF